MLGLNTPGKCLLFIAYIALWTNQGILVHLSKVLSLKYNVTLTVLLQDVLKLVISVILFSFQEGSLLDMKLALQKHKKLFLLYLVPAGMYAIYNNLTFTALSRFDPASYFVLMQFKIIVTAGLSIAVLGKEISKVQWAGLSIIMVGSMLKEASGLKSGLSNRSYVDYGYIIVQLLLSAFAGVYTEKLLKGRTDASPNIQNFYMYIDGMLINCIGLVFQSGPISNGPGFTALAEPLVFAIILNAACTGVVTGFFLKTLGSILKTIAASLELWTTALLSWAIFGYEVDSTAGIGIGLVSLGVWLYSEGAKPASMRYSKVPDKPLDSVTDA